jgi:hypothetical protein
MLRLWLENNVELRGWAKDRRFSAPTRLHLHSFGLGHKNDRRWHKHTTQSALGSRFMTAESWVSGRPGAVAHLTEHCTRLRTGETRAARQRAGMIGR